MNRSTNPSAMISYCLTTYLRRSCWTALSPCPLAKEFDVRHPRRPYYYLSSNPRPNSPPTELLRRIILSPSQTPSSTPSLSEDPELDQGRLRSPSPEIDLSPPPSEFDDELSSFIPHLPFPSHVFDQSSSVPPLEKDEKEFTQTADVLQKRKLEICSSAVDHMSRINELDEWSRDEPHWEDTKCPPGHFISIAVPTASSPSSSRRPSFSTGLKKEASMDNWAKLERLVECDCYPETIDLEELDFLLGNP